MPSSRAIRSAASSATMLPWTSENTATRISQDLPGTVSGLRAGRSADRGSRTRPLISIQPAHTSQKRDGSLGTAGRAQACPDLHRYRAFTRVVLSKDQEYRSANDCTPYRSALIERICRGHGTARAQAAEQQGGVNNDLGSLLQVNTFTPHPRRGLS